jgi:hypothetical protein
MALRGADGSGAASIAGGRRPRCHGIVGQRLSRSSTSSSIEPMRSSASCAATSSISRIRANSSWRRSWTRRRAMVDMPLATRLRNMSPPTSFGGRPTFGGRPSTHSPPYRSGPSPGSPRSSSWSIGSHLFAAVSAGGLDRDPEPEAPVAAIMPKGCDSEPPRPHPHALPPPDASPTPCPAQTPSPRPRHPAPTRSRPHPRRSDRPPRLVLRRALRRQAHHLRTPSVGPSEGESTASRGRRFDVDSLMANRQRFAIRRVGEELRRSCSAGRMTQADRTAGPSADRTAGPSADRTAGPSVDRSVGRSDGRSVDRDRGPDATAVGERGRAVGARRSAGGAADSWQLGNPPVARQAASGQAACRGRRHPPRDGWPQPAAGRGSPAVQAA